MWEIRLKIKWSECQLTRKSLVFFVRLGFVFQFQLKNWIRLLIKCVVIFLGIAWGAPTARQSAVTLQECHCDWAHMGSPADQNEEIHLWGWISKITAAIKPLQNLSLGLVWHRGNKCRIPSFCFRASIQSAITSS